MVDDNPILLELNMPCVECRQGTGSHSHIEANKSLGIIFIAFMIQAISEKNKFAACEKLGSGHADHFIMAADQ